MKWSELQFFTSPQWEEVKRFLKENPDFLPTKSDILNAFKLTPYDQVRVVIIGQDPYPTPGHAHGLAFSVRPEVKPLPASLQNIFKEMREDIGSYPKHGCLSHWAKQGVLLLNTSLTVAPHKAGSHKDIGWVNLIDDVITALNKKESLIFVLWGRHAQQFETKIAPWHHTVKSAHPSPLSARNGFFGSKPFSKINEILAQTPINWC